MNSPVAPIARRYREGVALILLAVAAILLQRAATAPWTSGHAPDGTRYEVSPIGVNRYDSSGTTSGSCRWWPRLGDAELCVIADAQAFTWLRRAYPFTVLALWTSVLALFLNALRVPRRLPMVRMVATAAVPALSLLALWCVGATAPSAIAALQGTVFRPLAGGFGLVVTATALAITALALVLMAREARRAGFEAYAPNQPPTRDS